ncbi:hypothetical protein ILUMI_00017 [Ignelater luminosus]|uniref:RNA-directed DNA polymerase n=1 Tax=Ignelater luminosus TaxID=2038154 RepID=A0A8K0DI35_IGNLU|nr:hypothetical protein ILUMI_00017 [Ignelater luminosus]
MKYLPGSKSYAADFIENSSEEQESEQLSADIIHTVSIGMFSMSDQKVKEFQDETAKHDVLHVVKSYYQHGWPTKSSANDELKHYFELKNITVENNLVYYKKKLLVPKTLRKLMLQTLHETRLGLHKVIQVAKNNLHWPAMRADIENYVLQTDTRPPNVRENDIHTNQMVIYDQQAPDAHNHSSDISTVAEVHSAKTFDIQASDTRAIHLQSSEEQSVSLSEIVELPIIPPKTSKRNIRKRKSIILTSTPVKDQLEEKENRKIAKEEEIKKKSQKTQKKEINTKRPKRNDMKKETKRVLKNFSNIKDFNEPAPKKRGKKKKRKKM